MKWNWSSALLFSKNKKQDIQTHADTHTHAHTNIIIPTCTLPLSLIYNIHNIYIWFHYQVVVVLHAWWLCFSAGSCFKSACTALFSFFFFFFLQLQLTHSQQGGQTKAWLQLICAAAANKHHSTEGRRATTLNRTWRIYAQKENAHHVGCTSHHLTAGDVYLRTARPVRSVRSFL